METLRYEKQSPIAIISFNRPDVLNAMNAKLWDELETVLNTVREDDEVSVLIFTGEGRAFSAGADLKESKTRSIEDYRTYIERLQAISKDIIHFEKPTIAAINGYAIGSGYELALACDIRIVADEAKIGSPEAKVASAVTGGASLLVQQLIGPGKARELLFTGEYIDGKEAERIGLVNKSVPLESLMKTSREMALKIAENSLHSIQLIKRGLLLASEGAAFDDILSYEVEACIEAVSSETRKKALTEFEDRKK